MVGQITPLHAIAKGSCLQSSDRKCGWGGGVVAIFPTCHFPCDVCSLQTGVQMGLQSYCSLEVGTTRILFQAFTYGIFQQSVCVCGVFICLCFFFVYTLLYMSKWDETFPLVYLFGIYDHQKTLQCSNFIILYFRLCRRSNRKKLGGNKWSPDPQHAPKFLGKGVAHLARVASSLIILTDQQWRRVKNSLVF